MAKTSFPLWEGKKLIYRAGENKFTPAKCEMFCQHIGKHIHPDLVKSLKDAILHGPIGLQDQVKDGPYRGALQNRIQGWFKKEYGFAFDSKNPVLNDAMTRSMDKDIIHDLYGQWNKTFDWNPGDFGDQGSCFWGCHSSNRYFLMDFEPAYAVQFYRKNDKGRLQGYGRCWVFVDYPVQGCMMIFNAYPKGPALPIYTGAILEGFRQVDKEFHDSLASQILQFSSIDGGWFYTNDGRASCLLTPKAKESTKIKDGHITLDKRKPVMTKFKAFLGDCSFGCNRPVMKDRPHIQILDPKKKSSTMQCCEYCLRDKVKQNHKCCICQKKIIILQNFETSPEMAKRVITTDGMHDGWCCTACAKALDKDSKYTLHTPKELPKEKEEIPVIPGLMDRINGVLPEDQDPPEDVDDDYDYEEEDQEDYQYA